MKKQKKTKSILIDFEISENERKKINLIVEYIKALDCKINRVIELMD